MAMKDITGLRYGKLVAIEPTEKRDCRGVAYWRCKCDCGNEKIVNGNNLRHGVTKSCGCLYKEARRNNAIKAYNAHRKHFGCLYCGSDKHYAKGYCASCYGKAKRGTLE